MRNVHPVINTRFVRVSMFLLLSLVLFAGTAFWSGINVSANHPVLLEGNCDSPIPGTTTVLAGTCGDFDGDTRIGTAEDTDGTDRIFGTLGAALSNGVGPAANSGANQNGTILIVTSGRFAETVVIGRPVGGPYIGGIPDPGNVTIEARPGVVADIDAVLQGDPSGGNNTRQGLTGIVIFYPDPSHADRIVTLRNLNIRNFAQGVGTFGHNKILIDNCRIEGNLDHGIRTSGPETLVITRSQIQGNGRRRGSAPSNTPNPGNGLVVAGTANAKIYDTLFSNNAAAGIINTTGLAANVTLFKVATFFNGTDIVGPFTIAPDPNHAN